MTTVRDETAQAAPPKKASIWRNRDYLLLWSGQSLSTIGSSVSELAFPLLVLAVTHSPAQAGLVAAARALPATLFSLFAGVLVDRWNRKRVMLFCEIGRFLSLASIPLAFLVGHLTIYQLYLNAFLEGMLTMLFNLAQTSSLGQLVPCEQLSSAFAQEEFMEGTTALCGPSLGGLLYALGQMLPFVTDAISYLVSIVTLVLIHTPFQGERKATRPRLLAEIREGIVWMWHQPVIRAMNIFTLPYALITPGSSLAIIVLAQQRGAPPFIIGLIFAIGGVGSILGALLAPFWEKHLSVGQAILVCRWSFALLWFLYVLMPFPILMGLVDFGVGFADPIEDVQYFSYRLALIPEALRGRVIAVCRMFPGLLRPLGLVLTGVLLQSIGPVPTLLLSGCCMVLLALLMTSNRHIRGAKKGQE
jgi:MFS family permease